MAYVIVEVFGNTSFGGYLEIDNGVSHKLEDGTVLEIENGPHIFEISTTSKLSRGMGKFQSKLSSMTSSSGVILDTLEQRQINNNLGDSWEFQVRVNEEQAVFLSIRSQGDKLAAAPMYKVIDPDEEQLAALKEHFDEIRAEQERIANTPRRSKKMIIWGLVMLFIGVVISLNASELSLPQLVIFIGVGAVGLLIFLLGMRKKIR
ncbi:MAG: hypothetical protein ACI3YH_06200 [Eubacteriales bacterium]